MQNNYLITFELKTTNWNYTAFYSALQAIGPWWHYLQSTWIVKSNLTAAQIYSRLGPNLSRNDYILIVEIVPGNKFGWLPPEAWRWIGN